MILAQAIHRHIEKEMRGLDYVTQIMLFQESEIAGTVNWPCTHIEQQLPIGNTAACKPNTIKKLRKSFPNGLFMEYNITYRSEDIIVIDGYCGYEVYYYSDPDLLSKIIHRVTWHYDENNS